LIGVNSNTGLRVPGMKELLRIYNATRGHDVVRTVLQQLHIATSCSGAELVRIPSRGAAVIVSNHPCGLLDGAALLHVVRQARADVKVLANDALAQVPELRDAVIPVDVLGTRCNAASVRLARRHLLSGGVLIVFPAGEVARGAESAWSASVARLIALAGDVTVVPAWVSGSNSLTFRMASLVHRRLGTALLVRELLNKRGSTVRVRFGRAVSSNRLAGFESDEDRIAYLRWRTDLLGVNDSGRVERGIKPRTPVAGAVPAAEMSAEVEALNALCASGPLSAYLARAWQIPSVLREIGRLREIAFRAAGEGTGEAEDIDRFDREYLHLFLWNHTTREVVGAYRLAPTDSVEELYTATLFHYGREFLHKLGPAVELGRSFIRLEYQRSITALPLLWKAICRFVHLNPQYKVLFGPVSISNLYSPFSRELIASFLGQRSFVSGLAGLVRARNPFRFRGRMAQRVRDLDDLSDAVSDVEASGAGVPVLLRQYLKLGGRLVGFNVDPAFANALDGLVVVDLTQTDRALLDRYFGRAEAERFLAFHRGEYGANANLRDPELDAARPRGSHPLADTLL
jgi:putative hemolysin